MTGARTFYETIKMIVLGKVVTSVKTGVPRIYNCLRTLDSGACPGPDPGFAGMTGKRIFRLFTGSSKIMESKTCQNVNTE